MNAGLADTHPSIHFYDSDSPGKETTAIASNFDEITAYQGLAHDVDRFKELARERGGAVLELCCGTGRVVIPLARQGHAVHAVDISEGMLQRLRERLSHEEAAVRSRVTIQRQDITRLDAALPRRFALTAHRRAAARFQTKVQLPFVFPASVINSPIASSIGFASHVPEAMSPSRPLSMFPIRFRIHAR